jgi:hypothetical protein
MYSGRRVRTEPVDFDEILETPINSRAFESRLGPPGDYSMFWIADSAASRISST